MQESTTNAHRDVEEWMQVCQYNVAYSSNADCDNNHNWSNSSIIYGNKKELPTFITRSRQTNHQHQFSTTADLSTLQAKQLEVYNVIQNHMEGNDTTPFRMIVSGTAGTGNSYLIHCIRLLLQDKVRVVAPTGVAAFNIDGSTLHSLLSLPVKGDFKDLEGEHLNKLQHSLQSMEYLIIDEISLVGRKLFGQVDKKIASSFSTTFL